MRTEVAIREKFQTLASRLNEHTRRVWAATEARSLGYGGISLGARATGIPNEVRRFTRLASLRRVDDRNRTKKP